MPWRRGHTAFVIAFVVIFALLGVIATQLDLTYDDGKPNHLGFWSLLVLGALLLGLLVVIGRGIVGRWDGVLIDSRNRVTLSQFQIVIWTLVVLSAYGAVLFTNLMAGESVLSALDVSVPPELLVAMGVTGTSVVGSRVINSLQGQDRLGGDISLKDSGEPSAPATWERRDRLLVRADVSTASWADLFISDYPSDVRIMANGTKVFQSPRVDITKLQMFFFTIVLAFAYAAACADLVVNATGQIDDLPVLDESFVILLGISHAGYLTRKAAASLADTSP